MTQNVDWDEARRYAKSGERAPGWPENVKGISISGAMLLGIDDQNQLYWDGHLIEVRRRFDLTFWQKLGAVIVVLGALGAVAQGGAAWFDQGCKLHWWSCSPRAKDEVPAISSQPAPSATSPQIAPQILLPGTKFQFQQRSQW